MCHKEMELEDPKDLRARFRKFLSLTNERKKMSKTTLRKRISLTAITALFAGVLTVTSVPVTSANSNAGTASIALPGGTINGSLFVATTTNTGGAAVAAAAGATTAIADAENNARSVGLLYKDSSSDVAQTATIIAGGKLSLYAAVTTTVAFTASAGTYSDSAGNGSTITYADPAKTTLLVQPAGVAAATTVATIWTAPTTTGTYTVSMYKHSGSAAPTTSVPTLGALAANITVTVVAASSGGAWSAANSNCAVSSASAAVAATTIDYANGTTAVVNGSWYINFDLADAYLQDLDTGNIVVTATNGALVNIGAGGAAINAGTASTVVAYDAGTTETVRVSQGTAGAPVVTTVTITYNGTTVCTKTVSIRGSAAKIVVGSVATADLLGSATTGASSSWLDDGTNRAGHFSVTLQDSAGNIVLPASASEFSIVSTTVSPTVTNLAVDSVVATSLSSTSAHRYSVGTATCGPVAGSAKVKLKHVNSATGVITTSDDITVRCANGAYSYTASFDKASYNQGDIATLTVSFKDSLGNAANSVDTVGTSQIILPMMTFVSATGTAATRPDAAGNVKYTLTVGTTTGMTAGTYTGIVDFTALTGAGTAVKATPTYKLSTGGDTTTNADVLKSIVALIASINKQIQALQKLILKR